MREQRTLRLVNRLRPKRRLTPAGRFVVGYAIAVVIVAYMVAEWVTRMAS